MGRGSSVGIAIGYGLDGPGSNPGVDEIFPACPDRPWGPPSLLYNGYRVFPGGRGGRGVGLTLHPHLECRGPRKSRAIPLLALRAFVASKKGENLPYCRVPVSVERMAARLVYGTTSQTLSKFGTRM